MRPILWLVVWALLTAGCMQRDVDPAAQPGSPSAAPATAAASERPPLRYVALGDSLAAGINGRASYADHYRTLLARRTGRQVVLTNMGRPGWTSAQLLDSLTRNEDVRRAVSSADVVTFDIGGNDLLLAGWRMRSGSCSSADGCIADATAAFRTRWSAIVDQLTSLRSDPDVPLLTFDLYLPAGSDGATVPKALATFNRTIRTADSVPGVEVAEVAAAFRSAGTAPLLSSDGLHPNTAGHRLIAKELLDLGLPNERDSLASHP